MMQFRSVSPNSATKVRQRARCIGSWSHSFSFLHPPNTDLQNLQGYPNNQCWLETPRETRASTKKDNSSVPVIFLASRSFHINHTFLCYLHEVFEVKATNGDTSLGGEDFDHAIVTGAMFRWNNGDLSSSTLGFIYDLHEIVAFRMIYSDL